MPSNTGIIASSASTPSWALAWKTAYDTASASGGQAHVMCLGDSITQGYYATLDGNNWASGWVGLMRAAIDADTGVASGTGVIPLYEDDIPGDSRLSRTGTWNYIADAGYHGQLYWPSSGSGATFVFGPVNCSKFRIRYIKSTPAGGGGTWTYKVDSGTPVAMTSLGTAFALEPVVEIDAGSYGSHTLTLTATSSGMYVNSVEAVVNETSGVRVSSIARSGKRLDQMLSTTFAISSRYCIEQLGPVDLALIAFGVNECDQGISTGTFSANLTTAVNMVQALGASVVLVVPPEPNPAEVIGTWADYVTVISDVAAAEDCGLINIPASFGPFASAGAYMYDNFHPNLAGHDLMGDVITNYVLSVV